MIQYSTTVNWDSDMRDVEFCDADDPVLAGLAIRGIKVTTGIPAAPSGVWLKGAMVQNIIDGNLWINIGTTASPSWDVVLLD